MAKKIKVLHVIGALTTGGVETWLYNIVNEMDLEKFQVDFMTFNPQKNVYDDFLTAKGCNIYYFPKTKNLFKITNYYFNTVTKNNYDIVHAHRHFLCSIYQLINIFTKAKFIAHSHNTSSDSPILLYKYFGYLSKFVLKFSRTKLACSEEASIVLFDKVEEIINYGIAAQKFRPSQQRKPILKSLLPQIDKNDIIVGHIGRFTEQKNHDFILDVAKSVIKLKPNYHFILIGEGILQNTIAKRIRDEELSNNIHILGIRTDVNAFMSGEFDLFFFPSLYEGLGIVLLEAQCAGLPCLISDGIPNRVDINSNLINREPLSKDKEYWATKLIEINIPTIEKRLESYEVFSDSPFTIEQSANRLKEIYFDLVK